MTPTRFISSGDVKLAVYRWGDDDSAPHEPQRPTVLLVHGYPDSARVWQGCAEYLAQRCRVIAYDVRGAGLSSAPAPIAAYALRHLVEDMAAVIDALSPDRAIHLVGHDWGSIQSWEAVTTPRLAGRIASYTSISGPSLDHAGYWIAQRLKSGSPSQIEQVLRQLAHSWYVGLFHLPVLAPLMWKLGVGRLWPLIVRKLDHTRTTASATQASDGSVGVRLYRANFRQRLLNPQPRHTQTPVQLIVPRRDPFMIAEIWDDLSQWVPNLKRRDIDAGHWVPLSHPQQIAEWIADFVEESAPRRDSDVRYGTGFP